MTKNLTSNKAQSQLTFPPDPYQYSPEPPILTYPPELFNTVLSLSQPPTDNEAVPLLLESLAKRGTYTLGYFLPPILKDILGPHASEARILCLPDSHDQRYHLAPNSDTGQPAYTRIIDLDTL